MTPATPPPGLGADSTFDLLAMLIWVGVPTLATVFVTWVGVRQQAQAKKIAEQAKQIEDVQARLTVVEQERDDANDRLDHMSKLFRSAIHHIREWMMWSRSHVPGDPPPSLPDELLDEV